jgi:hypothetical protein
MSQGDVMDLDDRIQADLRRLQRQRPDQYRHVEHHLRGFHEDLDDYTVEITRGEQTWQITTAEEWDRLKCIIETTRERFREAMSAERPASIPPLVKRQSAKPVAARKKAVADEDDFSWLPRARLTGRRLRRSQASQAQPWRPGAPKATVKPKGQSTAAKAADSASRTVNKNSNHTSPVDRPASASASARLLVRCIGCGAMLRQDRLARHQDRCPASKRTALAKNPAEVSKSPPARDVPAHEVRGQTATVRKITTGPKAAPPEDLGHADPRDASKYWGHHVRDHGRFGSYPVHDGYGDEADP